jgi:hypothetical protein
MYGAELQIMPDVSVPQLQAVSTKHIPENCDLVAYYVTGRSTSIPTFRDNLKDSGTLDSVLRLLTLKDGTDRLSRNVGNKLPLFVV